MTRITVANHKKAFLLGGPIGVQEGCMSVTGEGVGLGKFEWKGPETEERRSWWQSRALEQHRARGWGRNFFLLFLRGWERAKTVEEESEAPAELSGGGNRIMWPNWHPCRNSSTFLDRANRLSREIKNGRPWQLTDAVLDPSNPEQKGR